MIISIKIFVHMDFLDYLYQTVKRGLELGYGIRTLFLHNQVCLGLFDLPIQNYIYKDGIPRHHIFRDFCIQNLQAFDYILLFVPLISSSFQCNSLLFPPSQQLLPEQQLHPDIGRYGVPSQEISRAYQSTKHVSENQIPVRTTLIILIT